MSFKDDISVWAKNRWPGTTLSTIIDYRLKEEPDYDMKPANDGVNWTEDQVIAVHETFVYGYWDDDLITFYLADLLQKTVGAIKYQHAHIFQDNDGFHRNQYAAKLNAVIIRNRRGL